MHTTGTLIQGTVTSLAYGGKGILRTPEQMVIFVPFTAPGDVIECRLTRVKKNYAEGTLVSILKPSAIRTTPLCPYFGTCGGCQLQHMTYPAQAAYKQKAVHDAISRIYPDAQVTLSEAAPLWAYRTHISMTLRTTETGFIGGYFAEDNNSLVQATECPIFCDKSDPILKILAAFIAELTPEGREDGKVKVLKDSNQNHIFSFHFKHLPKNFAVVSKKYLKDALIGISGSGIGQNATSGTLEMNFSIDGKQFTTSPDAFLQAHPEQSAEIYREVGKYLEASPANLLIDLYCGIGVSSILASPFAKAIEGVEMNKTAVKLAKKNADRAKLAHVNFTVNSVEKELDSLLKKNPDAAIVNPPREGLSREVAEKLATSQLKTIIYISCQPATLSRDLQILKKGGYSLKKVQAFDMFPQTGHVETLAFLSV